jgi:hypothetical protein
MTTFPSAIRQESDILKGVGILSGVTSRNSRFSQQ